MWKWVIAIWFLGVVSSTMSHQPPGVLAGGLEAASDIGVLWATYRLYKEFMRWRAGKRAARTANQTTP